MAGRGLPMALLASRILCQKGMRKLRCAQVLDHARRLWLPHGEIIVKCALTLEGRYLLRHSLVPLLKVGIFQVLLGTLALSFHKAKQSAVIPTGRVSSRGLARYAVEGAG